MINGVTEHAKGFIYALNMHYFLFSYEGNIGLGVLHLRKLDGITTLPDLEGPRKG